LTKGTWLPVWLGKVPKVVSVMFRPSEPERLFLGRSQQHAVKSDSPPALDPASENCAGEVTPKRNLGSGLPSAQVDERQRVAHLTCTASVTLNAPKAKLAGIIVSFG